LVNLLLYLLVNSLFELNEERFFVLWDSIDVDNIDFGPQGFHGPRPFNFFKVQINQVYVLIDEENVLVDQLDFGGVDLNSPSVLGQNHVRNGVGVLDYVQIVVQLALDDGGDGESAVLGGEDVDQEALHLGVGEVVKEVHQGAVADHFLERD